MKRASHHPQSGSAFFIILVAIAMFSALSYVSFKGSRISEGALSSDRARIAAQDIISYGDAVAKAVQSLRLRGCSPNQITFEGNSGKSINSSGTAYIYTNALAPTDESCHVFSPNGGQVNPALLSQGHIPPSSVPAGWMDSRSFVIMPGRVVGLGEDAADSDSTDLIMWIGRLTRDTCVKINEIVGVDNPGDNPPIDTVDCNSAAFTGSYPACANPFGDSASSLKGKSAFCSQDVAGDSNQYVFKRVLLVR